MYFLNYIYFLIITSFGLKFLFQKQGTVIHPLNKKQKLLFTGPELFWTLTFSTGLLALNAPAGLDLMAIRLLVLEIFCLIGLFVVKSRPVWSVTSVLYLIYIIWLFIGLSYTESISYGIRVILKYLYPFFIMLFASAVVRNWEVYIKAAKGARIIAVVSIIFAFVPFIGKLVPGVFWYGTARAINYISMTMLSLGMFFYMGRSKKDLLLSVLFMLPCVLWVFRTSIMGTILGLMVFSFFRYKLKSLPVIFLIFVLGVCSVFFIPSIKEKMFKTENLTVQDLIDGKISKDDIDSNSRFAMWEYLENKFYNDSMITGSGTGSVQNHMYNNFLFGGLKVPHNDFVQIRCDNGLIGYILYLLIAISAVVHSFIIYNRYKFAIIRMSAIVAGSTVAGVVITMVSDNVVNYSMATLSYPFGFYGMMLGLVNGYKQKKYDFSSNSII